MVSTIGRSFTLIRAIFIVELDKMALSCYLNGSNALPMLLHIKQNLGHPPPTLNEFDEQ